MRVATIDVLIQTIAQLYPVTFTPNQAPAFTEQYRGVLSALSGDELNAAWHKTMETWKKKAGPTAADILTSHRALSATKPKSAANGNLSVIDRLAENDRLRNEDRRKLIDGYTEQHASGFEMARTEGWHFQLETQVKRAAHMISQRNEHLRLGKTVLPWRAEFCDSTDDNRIANFIPWFSIVTDDVGEDRIEIDQQTLRVWRAQAQIEGPPLRSPPSKSSTFKRAAA